MAMLESKGQLKDRKTEAEAEITNRRTVEVLLVRYGEETLCHDIALCYSEDPLRNSEPGDQRLKGLSYAAAKQPSSRRSKVPFPKRELVEP